MQVITSSTGRQADALREALRMTNESFAEHICVFRPHRGELAEAARNETATRYAELPDLLHLKRRAPLIELRHSSLYW